MKRNILDVVISKFMSYTNTQPQNVNLLDYLQDDSLKEAVDEIRSVEDQDRQKALKAKLPAITVSGQFKKRNAKGLIEHSNLLAFDVDNIEDMAQTFDLLKSIPYVVYCAKSVRGKGYWGIFWISNPKMHKEHFDAMDTFFKSRNINIDKAPSSVASLRGYSYDDQAYFNFNAQQFVLVKYSRELSKKTGLVQPKLTHSGNPFIDFNQNGDIHLLLIKRGWTYYHTKGSNIRYTRPGKKAGISADYHRERKLFYVFSSDPVTGLPLPKKAYNHVSLFCKWECNNDLKLCAKKLRAMGYGKR